MHSNVWYLDHDNDVRWQLTDDDVALPDHTAITRLVLELEHRGTTVTIDSVSETTFFDIQTGQIVMNPKLLSTSTKNALAAGTHEARLIAIDASNPDGIVWIDGRSLKVIK